MGFLEWSTNFNLLRVPASPCLRVGQLLAHSRQGNWINGNFRIIKLNLVKLILNCCWVRFKWNQYILVPLESYPKPITKEAFAKLHLGQNLRFWLCFEFFANRLWPIGYVDLQKIESEPKSLNFGSKASFAKASLFFEF